MAEQLHLVPVDDSNRAAVLKIGVSEDQVQLVAPNSKSLRQASEDASLVPRALVEGGKVVGFAMYQPLPDGTAYIWRIMVDVAHQRRGLGRAMMGLLIAEVRAAGHEKIYISHRPQNRVAELLFESFGFEEHDIEPDGEVVRVLEKRP